MSHEIFSARVVQVQCPGHDNAQEPDQAEWYACGVCGARAGARARVLTGEFAWWLATGPGQVHGPFKEVRDAYAYADRLSIAADE